jgi:hypothetical protein
LDTLQSACRKNFSLSVGLRGICHIEQSERSFYCFHSHSRVACNPSERWVEKTDVLQPDLPLDRVVDPTIIEDILRERR